MKPGSTEARSEPDDETKRLLAELEILEGRGLSKNDLCRALRISKSNLSRLRKHAAGWFND